MLLSVVRSPKGMIMVSSHHQRVAWRLTQEVRIERAGL